MNANYFQVILRVRRLLHNEDMLAWNATANDLHSLNISQDFHMAVESRDRKRIMESHEQQHFSFDFIEQEQKTQGLYVRQCRNLVKQTFNGYHGTIMCYGQTTSGKTFTTLGTAENPGIIPCTLRDVFNAKSDFKAWIQYVQIYNEQLDDLLNHQPSKITIIDDQQWGTQIQNAKKLRVKNFQEAIELLNEGEQRRIYRATKIHDHSSRSHTVFKIYIENTIGTQVTHAVLNLIDLAGSERLSEADQQSQSETGYINKSLFTLTNVINKLADKQKHIPFRDSKLTRILKDSLGGNSLTLLICCISPARKNFIQTLSTLKFANRAKLIKNSPTQQLILDTEDPRDKEITLLREENKSLIDKLQSFERQQSQHKSESAEQTSLPSIICPLKSMISDVSLDLDPTLMEFESFRIFKQLEGQYQAEMAELTNQFSLRLQHLLQYVRDTKVLNLIQYTLMKVNNEKPLVSADITFPIVQKDLIKQLQRIATQINNQIDKNQVEQLELELQTRELGCLLNVNANNHTAEQQIKENSHQKKIQQLMDIASKYKPEEVITQDMLRNGAQQNQNIPNNNEQNGVKQNYKKNQQSGKTKKEQKVEVTVGQEEYQLYVWGSNQDGRLGLGEDLAIAKQPRYLNNFQSVACGSHHTIAINQAGHIFVWGRGQKGQLGLGNNENVYAPQQLLLNESCKQVACGWQHSLALGISGNIYSWGYGEDGQLGHGDGRSISSPQIISDFVAEQIFAGHSHSAFLNGDELYTFGSNWDGRCLIGELGAILSPQFAIQDQIRCVSLGVSHSGVVLSNGQLVMAGTGTEGQLGIELNEDQAQTIVLERLSEELGGSDEQSTYEKEYASSGLIVDKFNNVKQVACGDRFTLVLTEQNRVYTFGKSSFSRLGFKAQENVFEPTPILTDIESIAVGCRHSAALSKSNELFMWGFNFHNQLGLGANDKDQDTPIQIKITGKMKNISLGYFHSSVLIS